MTEARQVQTGFAEVNDTRLYYEVAGEGHPLVLIHGGLVDRCLWDDQFDVFAQHYKVIRYDVRGFGDSALLKKDTKPYSLVEDLYSLLKFLGVEKTYLVGLSMGGAIAIDFTLEHPEMVDALITVGAGLAGFSWEGERNPIEDEIEDAYKQRDVPRAVELTLRMWTDGPYRTPEQVDASVRERVHAMTRRNFERLDDEDASSPQELGQPAIERLSEISVPTLIIVGDQDVRTILKIADTLETGITGAKRAVISGTAHHLNMEKPEEFNQVVLDFLGSLA